MVLRIALNCLAWEELGWLLCRGSGREATWRLVADQRRNYSQDRVSPGRPVIGVVSVKWWKSLNAISGA